MKPVEMSHVLKLTRFELLVHRRKIMGWSLCVFVIMFIYMILFSSIQEIAQVKMDAMPKELLQLVGMSDMSDMSHYITYFGMIFNLVLIAVSLFATTFSAGLIVKDEQTKSIEFLASLSVSRTEIYVSKLLTAFVGVLMVISMAAISALICGLIGGGETFVMMDFITIVKFSSVTPFFFIAIAFLCAGAFVKISPVMVSSGVVILTYVAGYLGVLLEDKAKWLLHLSPFELFSPTHALALERSTLIAFSSYVIIAIIAGVVGHYVYKRRDFVV